MFLCFHYLLIIYTDISDGARGEVRWNIPPLPPNIFKKLICKIHVI